MKEILEKGLQSNLTLDFSDSESTQPSATTDTKQNMKKTASDYRYERKFELEGLSFREVEYIVKRNPFHFREIYAPRFVNNIYFDSIFAFQSYFENVDGAANRVKVRIRWYGDLLGEIKKPVLEYKIKQGEVGTKKSYRLPSFILDHHFNYHHLKTAFCQTDLPEEVKITLKSLAPAMMNRYERKYYLSADGRFRITIDKNLKYYRINTINNSFLNKQEAKDEVVLELKYGVADNKDLNKITNHFPFRLTKSSKYVKGMDLLYNEFF